MGLAGRKTKQRIGADPRNLTWSDDSSKFGAKYLQSLGWTSGTGLGATGEGRTSNLKIHQKLDLMGIGANRRGPGGDDAGWRGGREFEGLLARLNQAQNEDTQDISVDGERVADTRDAMVEKRVEEAELGAVKESAGVNGATPEICIDAKEGKKKEDSGKKKRKRLAAEDDEVNAKEAKRRRKEEKREEKREKKEKKKAEKAAKKSKSRQASEIREEAAPVVNAEPTPVQSTESVVMKAAPRYRAHRARNLASKRLAAASETGMNEILGIASSTTSGQSSRTSSIPFPTQDTPSRQASVPKDAGDNIAPGLGLTRVKNRLEQAAETDDTGDTQVSTMGLGSQSTFGGGLGFRGAREETAGKLTQPSGDDLLRKSGKSVAEYFAEKMRMKSAAKDAPVSDKAEEPQRKKGKKEKN